MNCNLGGAATLRCKALPLWLATLCCKTLSLWLATLCRKTLSLWLATLCCKALPLWLATLCCKTLSLWLATLCCFVPLACNFVLQNSVPCLQLCSFALLFVAAGLCPGDLKLALRRALYLQHWQLIEMNWQLVAMKLTYGQIVVCSFDLTEYNL